MKFVLTLLNIFVLQLVCLYAQLPPIKIGGGMDNYYLFNFNQPASGSNNYFVTHNKHNEVNMNLAWISFKYDTNGIRSSFIPAFGTYMEANYAAEPPAFRNLLDANIGVRLSKRKNIWLDAGLFASPITDEGYFSFDQLTSTRSLASEFTPYYLCGVKLSVPISSRVIFYGYVVNGWQQIVDINNDKSVLGELEVKIKDNISLDYNVYFGNQQNLVQTNYRNRLVNNVYLKANLGEKSKLAVNGYIIQQFLKDTLTGSNASANIFAINAKYKYMFTPKHSISLRGEYIEDTKLTDALPASPVTSFNVTNASIGYDFRIQQNAMFRLEARAFFSDHKIFDEDVKPVSTSNSLIANLCFWF